MVFRKYIRQHMYGWHRTLSLLIALPVFLWALSGLMHPIMTSFKPAVKNQALLPPLIDTALVKVPLSQALLQNNINVVQNIRVVRMGQGAYYQVQLKNDPVLQYISCRDGKLLPEGDALYARQLAMAFLGDGKAAITGTTLVTSFTDEYRDVNRLLPVYRVAFNRNDGIVLYVDNWGDRMGLATDDFRIGFQRFFTLAHTWDWLSFAGGAKQWVEAAFAALALLTSFLGLYIFFITKKPRQHNAAGRSRRRHRTTSLIAVLFTAMFAFSGGWHALQKIKPDTRWQYFVTPSFASADLSLNLPRIDAVLGEKRALNNLSIVQLDGQAYWRIAQTTFENKMIREECCANATTITVSNKAGSMVGKPGTVYIHAGNYTVLPDGELQYARYLANTFSGNKKKNITEVAFISRFEDEYGFVNKRLPVVRVRYNKNDNERYYVETATGKLSVKVQDSDLREGYSFALLHKHHFMDWAGKTARDVSTMLGACLTLLAILVGIWLFIVTRRKNRTTV